MPLAFLDWLTADGLVKVLRDTFVVCFDFLRDLLWTVIKTQFGPIAICAQEIWALFTSAKGSMSAVTPYTSFANAWVPVDLFFTCLSAYMCAWGCLVVYKFIKSWLPTLSGGG